MYSLTGCGGPEGNSSYLQPHSIFFFLDLLMCTNESQLECGVRGQLLQLWFYWSEAPEGCSLRTFAPVEPLHRLAGSLPSWFLPVPRSGTVSAIQIDLPWCQFIAVYFPVLCWFLPPSSYQYLRVSYWDPFPGEQCPCPWGSFLQFGFLWPLWKRAHPQPYPESFNWPLYTPSSFKLLYRSAEVNSG